MGDRFNNSNGLPMASEDSEEFLTILGKKMASSWRVAMQSPGETTFYSWIIFFVKKH